jgi:photosystem II stability/assembly factor-like uncharacterized protein
MIDDIEVIRRFRNEPFEPDAEVVQDAREQLAAAMLRDQLGEPISTRSIRDLSVIDSTSAKARHGRRVMTAAICSIAALVALVVYVATPKSAIRGGGVATLSAQHWQLAGFAQSDWQPNPSGPTSGLMTCPVARLCYIVDGDPVVGPADGMGHASHLIVSMDDGATWTEEDPVGVTSFTTPLVCPEGNGENCIAGGMQGNDSVLLASVDGGVTWTSRGLPKGAGRLIDLSCTSLTHCVGVMTSNQNVFVPGGGLVFTTEDGGSSWARSNSAGVLLQLLACSGITCVGSGTLPSSAPGQAPAIVTIYSDDSGATWTQAKVPAGFGFLDSSSESVECADATHCLGVGEVQSSPTQPDTNAVVASSDGGATWQLVPALTNYATRSISCATDRDCWIAGGGRPDPVTSSNPITYKTGEAAPAPTTSPVVFATQDAGLTWSKITVPMPKQVPVGTSASSLTAIGQISCPTVTVCVGLGSGDLSTEHTATYTDAPTGLR